MKYLYERPYNFLRKINNKNIFLFLDYDGTLVSIKKTPVLAKLPLSVKSILLSLVKNKDIKICIISGRALKDIKKLVSIRKIIYVANHGMIISYNNKIIYKKNLSELLKKKINELKIIIKKNLSDINGILFEDKGEIFSIHYRMVLPKKHELVIKKIKKIINEFKKYIILKYGKKIIEIFPLVDINKGRAVKWILKRFDRNKKFYPVYIGDDLTDEYAFKVLKKKGLTICVGRKKTFAEYYVKNVEEVKCILKNIKIKKSITYE